MNAFLQGLKREIFLTQILIEPDFMKTRAGKKAYKNQNVLLSLIARIVFLTSVSF